MANMPNQAHNAVVDVDHGSHHTALDVAGKTLDLMKEHPQTVEAVFTALSSGVAAAVRMAGRAPAPQYGYGHAPADVYRDTEMAEMLRQPLIDGQAAAETAALEDGLPMLSDSIGNPLSHAVETATREAAIEAGMTEMNSDLLAAGLGVEAGAIESATLGDDEL